MIRKHDSSGESIRLLTLKRFTLAASFLCGAFVTTSASAKNRTTVGHFVPVVMCPKAAQWETSTDAIARNSGSNSVVFIEPNSPGQTLDPGIRMLGVLGSIAGGSGPVGFVRVTTEVNVNAAAFDSIALPIEADNPELVITVLLQDSSQLGSSEWFEATISPGSDRMTGVGEASKDSSVRFLDFRRFFRGREVAGPQIDKASIRGFGIQLARSTQTDILRNGGDIEFALVLAGMVSAINTPTEYAQSERDH
jgi:Complex I intermediate-associated protein 30 (CIA30)